jgi:hypothetical protein
MTGSKCGSRKKHQKEKKKAVKEEHAVGVRK